MGHKTNVITPFGVEFARESTKRGGAPTLVPVESGGCPVKAQILLLDVVEQEAKDRLWRREIDRIGEGGHYVHRANPGPNTLIIDRYEDLGGVAVVLAARFAATITPLTAEHLARWQFQALHPRRPGAMAITYLIDAKRNGITTPLSSVIREGNSSAHGNRRFTRSIA